MNNNQKPLVFFDMDGTLTESRGFITPKVVTALEYIDKLCTICIVSGSDIDYINSQMEFSKYKSIGYKFLSDIYLYACNGTKVYHKNILLKELLMSEFIEKERLYSLVALLIDQQSNYINYSNYNGFSSPLTGNHIHNRGSMINWSPIGRNADRAERDLFVKFDKKTGFREDTLKSIREYFNEESFADITVVKGGDTSFDIYPNGWDKRLVLNDLREREIYFVGDRCEEGGNDYELFKEINDSDNINGQAFATNGPEDTIRIIYENIYPMIAYSSSSSSSSSSSL